MKQTQYAIEAADLTITFGDLMVVDARAFFYTSRRFNARLKNTIPF